MVLLNDDEVVKCHRDEQPDNSTDGGKRNEPFNGVYPAADGGGGDAEVDDEGGGQEAECVQSVVTQHTADDDGANRRGDAGGRDGGTIKGADERNKEGKEGKKYDSAHGGESAEEVQAADEMEDDGGGENL